MRGLAIGLFCLTVVLGLSCAPSGEKKKIDIEVTKEKEVAIELPKEMKARLKATLDHIHARELDLDYSFWTIFHAILGMGFDTTLVDRKTDKRVNAIEHICSGKEVWAGEVLRGLKFFAYPEGVDVRIGPIGAGQGHQDQFIAEMAQWGMPADKKFIINGKEHRFIDFVRYSKWRVSATGDPDGESGKKVQELGWAVLIIPQYFGVNLEPWTNMYGEKVSLEDLVRTELKVHMPKAACGGTHSLFGLTWAYFLHLQAGGKAEGVWADVDAHLKKYADFARKYQNADGSFSSEYINGGGETKDPDRRINTTGHVIEWLALYLPDDELRAPWMQNAVMALCKMVLDHRHENIDGGSLYHATHGLHIYYDRVFDTPNSRPGQTLIPLPSKAVAAR